MGRQIKQLKEKMIYEQKLTIVHLHDSPVNRNYSRKDVKTEDWSNHKYETAWLGRWGSGTRQRVYPGESEEGAWERIKSLPFLLSN